MRKPSHSVFALIIYVLMLTVCNKESSNSLLALLGLGGGEALTGTFVKHVFGAGSVSSNDVLFNTASADRFMILSLAADIKGEGFISSISFKFNGYHASTFRKKLRVLHTPMRLNGLYMQYVWHTGRAM